MQSDGGTPAEGEQQLGYTDGDDPIYADGRPDWMEEPYRETSLEDGAVIVDCPRLRPADAAGREVARDA